MISALRRPWSARARSDAMRRSTHASGGLGHVQGPRRFDSIFHKIGHGLEHLGQQVGHEIQNYADGPPRPDPRKFSGQTMPTNTSNGSPYTPLPPGGVPGGSGSPPGGSHPYGTFGDPRETQAYNAMMQNPDLAGILDGIARAGGDVVGWVKDHLPHDASGNIDWGQVGSDVAGWVAKNAGTLIQAATSVASAVNDYQRQQKSDQYANQALTLAKQNFAANAPLRDAGRSGMLDPQSRAPSLTALSTLATSGSANPFAKALPLASSASSSPTNGGALPLASMPAPAPPSSQAPTSPNPFDQFQFVIQATQNALKNAGQGASGPSQPPLPPGAANGQSTLVGQPPSSTHGAPVPTPAPLPMAGAPSPTTSNGSADPAANAAAQAAASAAARDLHTPGPTILNTVGKLMTNPMSIPKIAAGFGASTPLAAAATGLLGRTGPAPATPANVPGALPLANMPTATSDAGSPSIPGNPAQAPLQALPLASAPFPGPAKPRALPLASPISSGPQGPAPMPSAPLWYGPT